MPFKHRDRSREKKLKKAEPRILGDLVMLEAAATLAIAEEDQDPERLKCAQFDAHYANMVGCQRI